MSANYDLITDFINAWTSRDIDTLVDFFAEDAIYINVPIPRPNQGKAEIRGFLEAFLAKAEAIEFVNHYQGETPEGVIMNERTDRFMVNGEWVEVPVMGIFEVKDGKISAWRDYFDRSQLAQLSSGG